MNMNFTIIGQVVWFALFVFFCMKLVWPPIMSALAERKQKIAEGLDAADKAGRDLEEAKDQIANELTEAKSKAAEILDQAHKRSTILVEEAKQQAQLEGDRIKSGAQAEVEQEFSRAKESLRSQVSALAIEGAEKILGASVDQKSHDEMLDQLAAKL